MRLFELAKVGMFLDQITHGVEEREGDEVKIVTLTLRVQPFSAELARTIPGPVRSTLFKLNHPDPHGHLKRVDFLLGIPRQRLEVFAAPDVKKAAILLDQVKVVSTYARTEKSINGFAFVWKGSFGPVGKQELEHLQEWLLNQRFVTTTEAEPGLFDDDEAPAPPPAERPAPMFDDPRDTGEVQ